MTLALDTRGIKGAGPHLYGIRSDPVHCASFIFTKSDRHLILVWISCRSSSSHGWATRADGAYRILYVAKFAEAVYVLHAFQKKTQKTAPADIELARLRFRALMRERKKP
jgi:Phage derived protein Gp49-like (DUF891)